MEATEHMQADETTNHHGRACLKWIAGGAALTAGALILSPYVLPLIGVGSTGLAAETMTALHATASTAGTGLAGFFNSMLGAVPLVGETLADGGMGTAIASGTIGIGGVLLGRYVGKHDDGKHYIKWGKVITTAALTASVLIALPTALTGISAGIAYLAAASGTDLVGSIVTFLAKTIGAANSASLTTTGLSGAALALPHLLTCGAAVVPAVVSAGLHRKHAVSQAAQVPAAHNAGGYDAHHSETVNDNAITASVRLAKPTAPGEEARGVLILKHTDTDTPLTDAELAIAHTKKIHFFVIDSSLRDYHHIHPEPTNVPGEYSFSFPAHTSQPYTGWATIVTNADHAHRQLKVAMPPAINRYIAPHVRINTHTDVAGLSFDWKSAAPLQKGVEADIEVTITDKATGKQVTDLQPVFGAWCHLEGFSADHKSVIHTHPTGREPAGENDRMSAPLHFKVTPEADGMVQFFVQVRRGNQDIFSPIGQFVKGPEKAIQRVMARSLMDAASSYAPPLTGMA